MGRSWKRAQPQGPAPRQFLTRQNSLHWVMDMVFRDDECRVRTDQAPANFTTLKHMAHNLIRKAPGKDSLRLKRKTAGGRRLPRKPPHRIIPSPDSPALFLLSSHSFQSKGITPRVSPFSSSPLHFVWGQFTRICVETSEGTDRANLRLMGARRAGKTKGSVGPHFVAQARPTCARRPSLGSRVSDRGCTGARAKLERPTFGALAATNRLLGLGHPVDDLREIVMR